MGLVLLADPNKPSKPMSGTVLLSIRRIIRNMVNSGKKITRMLMSSKNLWTIQARRNNFTTNAYRVRCKKDVCKTFLTRMVMRLKSMPMSIAGPRKTLAFSQSINEDLRLTMMLAEAWGPGVASSIKCINRASMSLKLRITRMISAL